MLSLPELVLRVKVDDKGAKAGLKGVEASANQASAGIGKKFQGLGKSIASAFGKIAVAGVVALGAAVIKITKDAFKATSEYEQLSEGLKLSMGDAYDYLEEKAANAWKTMGLSMNDYYDQASNLAVGLKNALGGDTQAAAELTDKILTAEADITAATGQTQEAVQNAFNGIMRGNFTMVDNLRLGITPTKEGYQEMIDKVNEWNAAQGHATEYQMGNYADMYQALVDYVDMQGMAGYAAKEAADTIQGSINSMKASWDNFLTALGSGDDSKIQEATKNLMESISHVIENSIPIIKNILKGIGTALREVIDETDWNGVMNSITTKASELMSNIGTWLSERLPELFHNMVSSITSMLESESTEDGQLMTGIKNLVKGLIEGVAKMLPDILLLAADLIVLAGQLLQALLEAILEALGALFAAIWDAVGPYLTDLWENIKNGVIDFFTGIWNWVKDKITTAWNFVKNIFETIVKTIKTIFNNIKSAIVDRITTVKDKVSTIFGNIKSTVTDKITAIKDKVTSTFNTIKDKITGPIEKARDKVKGIIDRIKGFFDFKVKLPNIPLPHFSLSPSGWKIGDLLKGTIPSLGIDWYAKGGFFGGPTILSGLGESGPEYALPLSKATLAPLAQMLNELQREDKSSSSNGDQQIIVYTTLEIDGRAVAKTTAPYMKTAIDKIDRADNRQLGYV